MTANLIVGFLMMVVCVAIQCIVVGILWSVFDRIDRRQLVRPTIFSASWILTAVMLIMLVGNLLQMALWARLFVARGEFTSYASAFYHSVVNFSTLGYGDLVMREESRLLGALEAANGILMLGLTTSVLFMVLQSIMRRAWAERPGQGA